MFISLKSHSRVINHMIKREEELLEKIEQYESIIAELLACDAETLIEYQLQNFMNYRYGGE